MSGQSEKKPTRFRALSDHKQVGKRFIPPMIEATGGVEGVSWIEQLLPELLWLGLLNETHVTEGPSLAVSLIKAAKEATGESPRDWFATTSSYLRLTQEQKQAVVTSLTETEDLDRIRAALAVLVAFYPECPLAFLFDSQSPEKHGIYIEDFKRILVSLMDRWDRPATLTQASMVYLGFVSDMLKVQEGMALANFPEVWNYPISEESMRVAASVRGTVSVMFGMEFGSKASPWSTYFWNRGFELQPCHGTWLQ
jgi:hypothetical protein